MKGHIVKLDGQLVCIFPFTNATSFERMAHNDLESRSIIASEDGTPIGVVEDDYRDLHFGWCFISTPVNYKRPIMERDRGEIAALAAENDAWAAEKVKEADAVFGVEGSNPKYIEIPASPTGYTDDTIFRLSIDDVQAVAFNYYGRELTDDEIAKCREQETKLSPDWSEDVSAWLTMVVFPDGLK